MTWQPVPGTLMTRWAKEVTPENAWREYPRPQLVRTRVAEPERAVGVCHHPQGKA